MVVEMKVTGLREEMKNVGRLNKNLHNMGPAYKKAVALYHGWILRNFQQQDGLHEDAKYKWKPLAESTVANRRKKSSNPLQDTGALRRDWELTSTSKYGKVKSAHKYSEVHEKGATIKARTITPKKKDGVLAWAGKNGKVFAKRVRIPKTVIPQRKIFPTKKQALKIVEPAFKGTLYKGVKLKQR